MDALFDLLKGAPRAQQAVQEALDEKALRALLFGAIVLGFSAVSTIGDAGTLTLAFTFAALGAFLFVAGVAIWQLLPKDYSVVDDADRVWECYWDLDAHGLKHATVERAARAYADNQKANACKAWQLFAILIALSLEAAAVAGAVVAAAA
jgi:hypothetical protein